MPARSIRRTGTSRLRIALIATLTFATLALAACGSDADVDPSASETSATGTSEAPTEGTTSSSSSTALPTPTSSIPTPTSSSTSETPVTEATPSGLPADVVELLERDDREVADATSADTFLAGYAVRDLPWRVGAKPGQVGTAGVSDRDARYARLLAPLLTIFSQSRRNPEDYLRRLDAWYPRTMDDVLVWPEPGKYASLYEPGRGIELPPAVNAVVLSSGDEHVAVVSADLYLPHEQLHRRVAHLVAAETGINRDRLFLMATHNHSAPHAVSSAPGVWSLADEFDIRHWVYMTRLIADTVIAAWEAREPAQVRTGRMDFDAVQQNIVGRTTVELAPDSESSAETIHVGYPRDHIDPVVTMVRLESRDTDPEPIATLFVLGMHPETLPDGHGITTGEFPRHVERKYMERTGAPGLWLTGALGDIEPDRAYVNPEADFWRRGFEAMDRMSDMVADAMAGLHEELDDVTPESDPMLLNIARDVSGPEDSFIPRTDYAGPNYPMIRVMQDTARLRFHMVRIHDVLLAGGPAEMPTDQSLNLRSRLETGSTPDGVFQGYVFPENPAWVAERVNQNFETTVAAADAQVPMVAIVSLVNAYTGYVVTRWEYENRDHYRQSLTSYGPGTAEYMNAWMLSLAEEMHGASPRQAPRPDWYDRDIDGFHRATLWFREAETMVPNMMRDVPVSDGAEVGIVRAQPAFAAASATQPDLLPNRLTFSWYGGTNDVDLPQVTVEREVDADVWETVTTGPGRDLFVYFDAPDRWSAHWRHAPLDGETYRFRVAGTYRSDQPDTSTPDPYFDPDGANAPYTLSSEPIVLEAEGGE